jgi:hypothetical protein
LEKTVCFDYRLCKTIYFDLMTNKFIRALPGSAIADPVAIAQNSAVYIQPHPTKKPDVRFQAFSTASGSERRRRYRFALAAFSP